IVGEALVNPAVVAMQSGLYSNPSEVPVHVSAWHGWTPELLMTIGIIGLGTMMFLTMRKWQPLYKLQPGFLSLNGLYDSLMAAAEKGMNRLSRPYMTGVLRTYLIYMFASIVVITLTTLFVKDAFKVDFQSFAPANAYGILTAVLRFFSVCVMPFRNK